MAANTDAPAWLNAAFFEELLRADERDESLIVRRMDVRLAVGKGENFASLLYKAELCVEKSRKLDHRFLIVKSLPEGEIFLQIIKESQIFEKETGVYLDVLPAYRKMQESSGAAATPLGCKCYPTKRPHTIVMEDLTRRGYRVADRLSGLDLAHSSLAVQALARFHALSLGLIKQDPSIRQRFPDTLLPPAKRAENHFYQDRNKVALAKEVATWKGYESYADKLKESDFLDKAIDLMSVSSKFSVLCHGDCWLNNMMFKYSDEMELVDLKFIDFQLIRYFPLTYDFYNLIYSSANQEVRTRDWDKLVELYYTSFVATLKSINYDTSTIFSLNELKKELNDHISLALLITFIVLPVVLASPEDSPDFSQMVPYNPEQPATKEVGQVSVLVKAYAGARYKRALQSLLPVFRKAGVL